MPERVTMEGFQAIAGGEASCFITLKGRRYNMMNAVNVEASVEKTKSEINILGRRGKAHRASSWVGKGSGDFYYNASLFRELMLEYKKTGKDVYFDMQITNEDPEAENGRQTTILINCNIDSAVIAKFEAGGEPLKESVSFTFDDFEIPETFTLLPGM